LELRRYGSLLKRWLWLIISLTLSAGLLAFVINSLTTPIYRASTTLLIEQAPGLMASPNYDSLLTGERLAKTYRELLRKRPVLSKVIERLHLNTSSEQLAANITVDIIRDTQLMVLSVDDSSQARAVQLANEIAREFNAQNQGLQVSRYSSTKQSLQQELDKLQAEITNTQTALDQLKPSVSVDQAAEQNRLQTLLAQYRSSYSSLLKSFEDVRLAEAQSTSDLTVVEEALSATKVRPNTLNNTFLAAFVGLVVAVGLAFLIEYLDDSIKSTEQVEQLTGVSTLGIIARIKGKTPVARLVTLHEPGSPAAEAYRVLRANVEFAAAGQPLRTLVITSSHSGEGKSTTAANLAVAFAQTGKRVLLVDADLRRPSLHRYFGLSNGRGVSTALLQPDSKVTEHLTFSGVENLQLLLSGPLPPNPAELLGSQQMLDLLEEFTRLADVVLFDSSPLLPVVDPTLLARFADATLIVVQSGFTRAGALKKAKNQLLQSGTRLLGVVLNRVSSTHTTYYYYYRYSYTSDRERSRPKLRLPFRRHRLPPSTFSISPVSKGSDLRPALAMPADASNDHAVEVTTGKGQALVTLATAEKVLGSLEIKSGRSAGQRLAIAKERVVLGRPGKARAGKSGGELQTSSLLVLDDAQVDREHLEIVHRANGVYLRNLSSSTGTWLNGRRLNDRPARLKDGAEIRLGSNLILIYHQGH
jgi:non-specific protein-tyrosine kinase